MSLRRLCFVLPMDADEAFLAAEEEEPRRGKQTARKALGSFVRGSVGRVLWCLRCRSCGGADYRYRDSSGVAFEDIAGVDDAGGRKFAGSGGGNSSSPRIFSYSELYIGTSGFSDKEILGSGGFGRVYRAVLPSDGTTVAVKCVVSHGDRFEKSFLAELAAVARLRHRNLVRLRGWCVHGGELLLVYDYMPNRSLDRLLFAPASSASKANPVLSWDRRRHIVAGLAAALFYLHEQLDTQIIHRDVKTSNVMLDAEYNARLGDFGLARWLEHAVVCPDDDDDGPEVSPSLRVSSCASASAKYHQFRLMDTSRIGGTIGYLPPESLQRRATSTAKSDVFSFGIVLLEVATGRRAVDLAYPDEEIFMLDWVRRLSDEGKLLNAADVKVKLPPAEDGAYNYKLLDVGRLIHLGLLCSLHDPKARPTMKWVVENLLPDGGCSGDLPRLPSFAALPKYYISLTSSSDSGTTTTIATDGTVTTTTTMSKPVYATAAAELETIYHTADDGNGRRSGSRSADSGAWRSPVAAAIPNVDMPREISYKEIVAITNDFSESQVVAELDFGTGYEGFLDNHGHGRVHVLVKRLGMKTCPALRVRFARELCNLANLRHRNLVQLRGWCTDHGEMLVVYDYSPGSLLSHYLTPRDDAVVLSWRQRYNIVKALASAILYLHEEWDEQVIHRNITSSAVFLDPDLNPRLGSFALAEFLSRNEHHGGGRHHVVVSSTNSARGIFGYMSPEYMDTGEATTMADVYSFGVVLLEVVTGTMAVDGRSPEVLLVRKVQHFEQLNRPVEALADRRLDDRFDRRELVRLAKLGIACVRSDPAARPSMRNIVSILDGNDQVLDKFEQRKESTEDWQRRNAANLALVRRFHALGIH